MEFISSYVRSIVGFIVFCTFIGIIIPSEKMKKYINLILGILLMLIIISPISNLISKNNYKNLDILNLTESENMNIGSSDKYIQDYENMLTQAYNDQFISMSKQLVNKCGYDIVDAQIETSSDLKEISRINLQVKEYDKKEIKEKLIRIEPINIENKGSFASRNKINKNTIEKDSEKIKKLKNTLSDFYNLSYENIYIKEINQ